MQKIKLPGDKNKSDIIAEMIRVNHAGEYGAKRIYQGQIKYNQDPTKESILTHMLEQELVHLDYFSKQIKLRNLRPSILNPLWHIGGFLLGAVTSKISEQAAMACTEAVETVIDEHYQEQLTLLEQYNEPELMEKIEQFRQEEVEHQHIAIENNAHNAHMYELLTCIVKSISRISIKLAKKL